MALILLTLATRDATHAELPLLQDAIARAAVMEVLAVDVSSPRATEDACRAIALFHMLPAARRGDIALPVPKGLRCPRLVTVELDGESFRVGQVRAWLR